MENVDHPSRKVEPKPSKKRRLPKAVVKAGSAAAIAAMMAFGADQGVSSVNAADNSPTPTVTPTPDVVNTRIAKGHATLTAVAGQLEKERQEQDVNKAVKDALDKLNILRTGTLTPTVTGTVTETPKPTQTQPPTATVINPADVAATSTARQDEAFGREKARLQTEYLRAHPPSPAPSPAPGISKSTTDAGNEEGGGFPLKEAAAGLGAAAVLGGVVRYRGKLGGWAGEAGKKMGPWAGGNVGKAGNWVKNNVVSPIKTFLNI